MQRYTPFLTISCIDFECWIEVCQDQAATLAWSLAPTGFILKTCSRPQCKETCHIHWYKVFWPCRKVDEGQFMVSCQACVGCISVIALLLSFDRVNFQRRTLHFQVLLSVVRYFLLFRVWSFPRLLADNSVACGLLIVLFLWFIDDSVLQPSMRPLLALSFHFPASRQILKSESKLVFTYMTSCEGQSHPCNFHLKWYRDNLLWSIWSLTSVPFSGWACLRFACGLNFDGLVSQCYSWHGDNNVSAYYVVSMVTSVMSTVSLCSIPQLKTNRTHHQVRFTAVWEKARTRHETWWEQNSTTQR